MFEAGWMHKAMLTLSLSTGGESTSEFCELTNKRIPGTDSATDKVERDDWFDRDVEDADWLV